MARTRMEEGGHTYKWDIAHIWRRYGLHMNEAWRNRHGTLWMRPYGTHEWGTRRVWMKNGVHTNEARRNMDESSHTYEWGMAHIWLRHGTHIHARNGNANEWVTSTLNVYMYIYMCVCVFAGEIGVRLWWRDGAWMSHVTNVNKLH